MPTKKRRARPEPETAPSRTAPKRSSHAPGSGPPRQVPRGPQTFLEGANAVDGHDRLQTPSVAGRIAEIGSMDDPVLRNLEITEMYHTLSNGLDRTIFAEDARGQTANWATFATWASQGVGNALRGEGTGLAGALYDHAPGFLFSGANAQLAEGNQKLFNEIAPVLSMFSENFEGDTERDPAKFAQFEAWLAEHIESGSSEDLTTLPTAMRQYYDAKFETDSDRKQELVLSANINTLAHEQQLAQDQVDGALPFGAENLLTHAAMDINLPSGPGPAGFDADNYDQFDISDGVRPRKWLVGPRAPYPDALESLSTPEARETWDRWDPSWRDPFVGAGNYTNLHDRMTFITELFRYKQNDANLFAAPFSPSQKQEKIDAVRPSKGVSRPKRGWMDPT